MDLQVPGYNSVTIKEKVDPIKEPIIDAQQFLLFSSFLFHVFSYFFKLNYFWLARLFT
jgi:hypothetical protein